MSFSVNTNVGALVALQNFGGAQSRLDATRGRVSTGLNVSGAKDDASTFGVAQGIRADIKGWAAIDQGLSAAQGLLSVTLAATTQISDLLGDLKKKVIEYHSTEPAFKQIIQSDVNSILRSINTAANGATFNGENLINTTDQVAAPPTPPPGEGTTFTFNGPGSNILALGAVPGQLQVDFNRIGAGGGNLRLIYDGAIVDSAAVNPGNPTGSLTFNFPAEPETNVTLQLVGAPSQVVEYSFTLTFAAQTETTSGYRVLTDIQGNTTTIQHRSMLIEDLDLDPTLFTSINTGLAEVEAAQEAVNRNLGYYGAAYTSIKGYRESGQQISDALTEGLGSMVDADLSRENARLAADKVRADLSANTLSIASKRTQAVLDLLRPANPGERG